MRRITFVEGEYYHVFNRGTDKRTIFQDSSDIHHFTEAMVIFNQVKNIGSLYQSRFLPIEKRIPNQNTRLVSIVCYALLSNHYHMLITPLQEQGLSIFMKRLNGGYGRFFNEKYKRSGSLFGSPYRATHIDSNEYLLHVSAYINQNHQVHQLSNQVTKFVQTSLPQYQQPTSWNTDRILLDAEHQNIFTPLCDSDIILDQFVNPHAYINFSTSSVQETVRRRMEDKNLAPYFLEI